MIEGKNCYVVFLHLLVGWLVTIFKVQEGPWQEGMLFGSILFPSHSPQPCDSSTARWHFFFFFFLQAQKKPAVLCGFLLETTVFMKNNLSRIRIAACNLAGETRVQVQGGS